MYRVKGLYVGVNRSRGVQSIKVKLLRDGTSVLREPIVKFDRTRITKMKDLDERVIPVEPASLIGSTVVLPWGCCHEDCTKMSISYESGKRFY